MTPERILLITLIAILSGLLLDRWRLGLRFRPWWKDMDMWPIERLMNERFDMQATHLTKVAAGLHEDIQSVRLEVRNLARLPDETKIPDLIFLVNLARVGMAVFAMALLALGVMVAHLAGQIARVAG